MSSSSDESSDQPLPIEQRGAQIGIWWYIRGGVHGHAHDVREVAGDGMFKDSDLLHFETWDDLAAQLKLRGEYDAYERGRVVYDIAAKRFVILCSDKVAADKVAIHRIMRHYSLPPRQCVVRTDQHYNPPDETLFDE